MTKAPLPLSARLHGQLSAFAVIFFYYAVEGHLSQHPNTEDCPVFGEIRWDERGYSGRSEMEITGKGSAVQEK